MKRLLNPVYLLIAFNLLFFAFGDMLVAEETLQALVDRVQGVLADLGPLGYLSVLMAYVICALFFIPLLIPLNIAAGALYGPYAGTAISLAGITGGCVASTISVRHVFTGMQAVVEKRPAAQKILAQIARHGAVVVLMVRLAFVVPYLLQNIVLALAPIKTHRLALLTAIGSLPGAAIYCFLGAGLMRRDDANALGLYLAVPLLVLAAVWACLKWLSAKYRVH